jgi:hypothetical protein
MDKFEMFLRNIESDKQAFTAYIKKHGYVEDLSQSEYSRFRDKVNNNDELNYAQKADLCSRYINMVDEL